MTDRAQQGIENSGRPSDVEVPEKRVCAAAIPLRPGAFDVPAKSIGHFAGGERRRRDRAVLRPVEHEGRRSARAAPLLRGVGRRFAVPPLMALLQCREQLIHRVNPAGGLVEVGALARSCQRRVKILVGGLPG